MGDLQTCLALLAAAPPENIAAAIAALEKPITDRKLSIGDRGGVYKYYNVKLCGYVIAGDILVRNGEIVQVGDVNIVPGATSRVSIPDDKTACVLQIGDQRIRMEAFGQGMRVVSLQVKTTFEGVAATHEWAWEFGRCVYNRITAGNKTINFVSGTKIIETKINDNVTHVETHGVCSRAYGTYCSYRLTLPGSVTRVFHMQDEHGGENVSVTETEIAFKVGDRTLMFSR